MSTIDVRPAMAEDCEALADLIGELLAAHGMTPPAGLAAALRRDGFGLRPCFEALLARRDGAVVGAALYYPTYRPSLTAPGLLLEDLYVRPEARRRGIAERLMTCLARIARERGCAFIEWTVEADNGAALGFYGRIGAQPRAGKACWQVDGAALDRLAGRS